MIEPVAVNIGIGGMNEEELIALQDAPAPCCHRRLSDAHETATAIMHYVRLSLVCNCASWNRELGDEIKYAAQSYHVLQNIHNEARSSDRCLGYCILGEIIDEKMITQPPPLSFMLESEAILV